MDNPGDFEEIFLDSSADSNVEADIAVQGATDALANPEDGMATPRKTYECSECSMSFPILRKLTKHMLCHEDTKKRKRWWIDSSPVPTKKMGSGCDEKCRMKCTQKITPEERQSNFEAFRRCNGAQEEWAFIKQLCQDVPIKKRKLGSTKHRRCAVKYYLRNAKGDLVGVCSKMFLETLSISCKRIKTALLKHDKATDTIESDKRGHYVRYYNCKSVNNEEKEMKQSVIRHIGMFPRIHPDFLPKNSEDPPLETGLNLVKMYALYERNMADSKEQLATVKQYTDYFNIIFNINQKEKHQRQEEHDQNLFHKTTAAVLMKEDRACAKERSTVVAAVLTFQNLLFAPTSAAEVFNYRHKLTVFNFTVFDMNSKEASCFLWDETVGRRGANEVSSVLIKYVRERKRRGQNEFLFWSDNSFARDENHIVFATYCWLAKHSHVSITHRFLEKGHTEIDADAMRRHIERVRKDRTVYLPSQWCLTVQNADKVEDAVEMHLEDFVNCHDLGDVLLAKKTENGEEIRWNEVKQVSVSEHSPDVLMYRYTFGDEEAHKTVQIPEEIGASVRKRKKQRVTGLPVVRKTPWPISKEKYKDLMFLCNNKHVPTPYHDFYKNLPVEGEVGDDSVEDEEEV